MSAPHTPAHPVLGALDSVSSALKDVSSVSPVFMESSAREVAMRGVVAARAQLDELELRLIACSADVAQTDAGRDVAAWQVAHNRRDRKAARADQRLAEALDRRYEVLRAGLADGTVHVDQAHVIARALDDLPAEVAIETRAKAETVLVGLAAQHTPSELRRLGKRILQALDLDDAEAALARRLEAEEASAFKKTSLSLRPDGDGTTRITAVLPDAVAHRLQTYLDAFTSPRRSERRGEGTYPQILGQAFCSLLERLDPAILPQHGGRATTVLVTISLESLRNDLGVGEVVGGEALSATEIRRLACTAGIAPVVLGGKGEVLDLGRERRLFSNAQNKAIAFRDKTCRAEGCDMPASMCETHHWREWSKGGRTDLNDGVSLCSHHHHRVHDPRYTADRLANGDVRFARRR